MHFLVVCGQYSHYNNILYYYYYNMNDDDDGCCEEEKKLLIIIIVYYYYLALILPSAFQDALAPNFGQERLYSILEDGATIVLRHIV